MYTVFINSFSSKLIYSEPASQISRLISRIQGDNVRLRVVYADMCPGCSSCVSINHIYCFLVWRYMSALENLVFAGDVNKNVRRLHAASIVGILKIIHHTLLGSPPLSLDLVGM